MSLATGTRLGPYEIISPLGAGGMGEVYRAKDTRLGREVAVKVLPAHLAESPELRERFEREARAISNLSHTNICALFDVGREGETDYLVMELLEGESLADRLQKGPLALDQILRFGMQIADALDKAHRSGVVHRDLKPGNVMLTRSGVKLLDFGLAKLREAGGGPHPPDLTSMPTTGPENKPLTREGTLMGTFQYMSPEQLEGGEVDARSDIFSLGAVLYEMTTGRKAFDGKSQASLIGAILNKEPEPISVLQPMTPPALDRVVRTCIAKDPEDRWQSAREVMHQLQWIAEGGSQVGVPAPVVARRKTRLRLAWILAAAFAVLAVGFAAAYVRKASVHPHPVRSYILPPEKNSFAFDAPTGGPALSPDGTRMVFAAVDATGKKILWIRPLDSLTSQPLEGTDEASFPFWSPDSRFVGFFVPGKLKKIDTFGGPPQSVCAASNGRGGSWSAKGVIVFAADIYGGLQRVPSAGGAPVSITELDKTRQQTSHRWPVFLPDGRHFIYWGGNPTATAQETNGLYIGSTDDKAQRFLLQADSDGLFCPPGYLLFLRDRSLMAQPFDAGSLKTKGEAFPVAEEVANPQSFRLGCFSTSQDGSLVYQTGENGRMQAVWLNASGGEAGTVGELAFILNIRLSPDGQRLAEAVQDPQTKNLDVWLLDLARGVKTRFTFDPSPDQNPVWSPDGSRVAFSSNQKGHFDIYAKNAMGAGDAEALCVTDTDKYVTDWSRDGRFITFTQIDSKGKTQADIFILPLSGDRKPYAFLQTQFNEGNAMFSPDGRWMAYQSNESGKAEVYVTSFPQAGGKWQVSQSGGVVPRWRHDGTGLYFRTPDGKLMAASVTAKGAAVEVGTPQQVSKIQLGELGPNMWACDSAPKEDRFIVLRPEKTVSTPLALVTHWTEGIKR